MLEPQPVKNYEVPDIEELVNEALVLVIAGTDTTTYTAAHATYYILSHSNVLKSFQDELQHTLQENGGRLEWANIRQLPYLVRRSPSRYALIFVLSSQTAIVQETLRLNPPVPGIAPRVVPPQGAQFGSHLLPGGVSCKLKHMFMVVALLMYSYWSHRRRLFPSLSTSYTETLESSPIRRLSIPTAGWEKRAKI